MDLSQNLPAVQSLKNNHKMALDLCSIFSVAGSSCLHMERPHPLGLNMVPIHTDHIQVGYILASMMGCQLPYSYMIERLQTALPVGPENRKRCSVRRVLSSTQPSSNVPHKIQWATVGYKVLMKWRYNTQDRLETPDDISYSMHIWAQLA